MEFNPSKCQVLHMSRSRKPIMSRYFMHKQELESVDTAKYLGMNISKDMSWNTHIDNITASANRTLGLVKRNVQTKNKDKIEMVQRRAATWVSYDYSTYISVTEMMSNLGRRSLENRRYDARLLMFYKIVYGLVAIPVPSYFERPEVNTRHTHSLAYIQIHTSVCYYQYSFSP